MCESTIPWNVSTDASFSCALLLCTISFWVHSLFWGKQSAANHMICLILRVHDYHSEFLCVSKDHASSICLWHSFTTWKNRLVWSLFLVGHKHRLSYYSCFANFCFYFVFLKKCIIYLVDVNSLFFYVFYYELFLLQYNV